MLRLVSLFVVLGTVLAAPRLNTTLPRLDGRIVGGQATNIALHPWQISLQYYGSHFCGGFLISTRWVITAAHCITEGYNNNLNVRAGSTNRGSGGQSVSVSRVLVHANWNSRTIDNDIASLQLASDVTVSNSKACSLPAQGAAIASGASVTITGWGALSENGGSTNTLQAVTVPAVSRANCRSAYGNSAITENMFCAGVLAQGGKDACQGDSGGPATVSNVCVGIVSWGNGCARPQYPGVYAQVSQYRNWIKTNTGV